MAIRTTISYVTRWPTGLVRKANFAHGTPPVGKRILDRVGAKIVRGIKDNIKNSRGVRGGVLKPLSPRTIAEKRNKGYAHPTTPLRAKGILYNAIKQFKADDGSIKVSIVNRGKPKRRDLAKWQQSGSYKGPRRVFFGISPQTRRDIHNLIRREFESMMRRSTIISQGKARGGVAFEALD